jgi:7-cyano-7-deazaguanine synthase
MTKGVAIVSGGMDSVTLAYMLSETTDELLLLSFDYGQRHRKELQYARVCANRLAVGHQIVPMAFMADLLHGSALTTGDVDVPEGHYEAESMKATVVPNRNMIMLSIAVGVAIAERADFVATGVHAGDHYIYPDCRPAFINSINQTAQIATEGFKRPGFSIDAPFVTIGKHDIVKLGATLNVPYEDTWSCYKGGYYHCGVCGTCVERKEAFSLAGVKDPTEYDG